MSIGMEDMQSHRRINLTQLRRNTRQRRDKKSGRKAPRAGDYEITRAPDAVSVFKVDMFNYLIVLSFTKL